MYAIEHSTLAYSYNVLQKTLVRLPPLQHKHYVKPRTPSESLHELSQLLPFLPFTIELWHTIGRVLYYVSIGSINGLDAWIAYSKQSSIVDETSCCNKWIEMVMVIKLNESNRNESIMTLLQMCCKDTPELYQQYIHTIGMQRVKRCILENGTKLRPCDGAEIMYVMYKDKFLYDENHGWYRYQWVSSKCTLCSTDTIALRDHIESVRDLLEQEIKKRLNEEKNILDSMRDREDKSEQTDEDKREIEESKNTVKQKEESRSELELVRNKWKELYYKNRIIAECKDLFYDRDGIIKDDIQVVKNITVYNIKEEEEAEQQVQLCKSQESSLVSFVKYIVMEDKNKDEVLSFTLSELLQKYNEFSITYTISNKVNHTIIRELKKLKIDGIKTSVRCHKIKKDILKTEFNRKEIKLYFTK